MYLIVLGHWGLWLGGRITSLSRVRNVFSGPLSRANLYTRPPPPLPPISGHEAFFRTGGGGGVYLEAHAAGILYAPPPFIHPPPLGGSSFTIERCEMPAIWTPAAVWPAMRVPAMPKR